MSGTPSTPDSSFVNYRDSASERSVGTSAYADGVDSSDSDREEVRVTASRFELWHDSWDAFFASLDEYQVQTSQLYRMHTTVKASARNQVIKGKKKWSETELIPEAFGATTRSSCVRTGGLRAMVLDEEKRSLEERDADRHRDWFTL
ncbi:hypothetical protein PHYPSEUDO_003452 [Phytophthora pseudosyringae]|uniref:Uncharacterized protein n=1 Tax=Phytophthora pseudosyringae TaxID=221518 RepID=A0A8T1WCL4_9STRA|nr:hypothetical protein PHYPSEUDO_003452 [Phytophthora pseudosyringae]